MAVKPVLWHNPRCSKSRAGLALLQDRGINADIRLYLKDAPNRAEIAAVHRALGLPIRDMIRTADPLFRDLGLGPDTTDDELLDAMAAHPALIERPILLLDHKAAIGRPTENLLSLI